MVDQLSELKIMEVCELVKALEEHWGVSAAAPVAAAAPAAGGAVEAASEQTEFTVMLTSAGSSKINVIKEIRAITSLGLAEAKALVESAPVLVKEGIKKDEAESIKEKLVAAGASVDLK